MSVNLTFFILDVVIIGDEIGDWPLCVRLGLVTDIRLYYV